MIEFDLSGKILHANKLFFGCDELFANESWGSPAQHVRRGRLQVEPRPCAILGGAETWRAPEAGFKRLGKGGREVWLQASYKPIIGSGGRPYRVLKFATDISARKMQSADFEVQVDAIAKSQAIIEFQMDGTVITPMISSSPHLATRCRRSRASITSCSSSPLFARANNIGASGKTCGAVTSG